MIYTSKREFFAAVLEHLHFFKSLEVWSSIDIDPLLKRGLVRATRKGLTLTAKGSVLIKRRL